MKRRRLKSLVLGAGLAALSLVIVLLRGVTLPAPTGPHAVARVTYRWTDASRPEVVTSDPNDRRAVVAHIWYPAAAVRAARPASYLPDAAALRPALSASPEFGPLLAHAVGLVHGHTLAGAPMAEGGSRFPVLIFLPGNRTNAALYSVLLEDLASHGYIVAALDHPYDVAAVRLPDDRTAVFAEDHWPVRAAGRITGADPHTQIYRERVEVRAQDAVFVLAQLAQLELGSLLGGRLDLTRVGVVGHSVGGVAAPRVCQLTAQVRACVNIDGLTDGQPFYLTDDGRGLIQPFLLLTKTRAVQTPSDAELGQWGLSRTAWEAGMVAAQALEAERLRSVQGGSYRVTLSAAQHDSFTDTPLLRPAIVSDRAATRNAELTRAYVRAFFDQYVRNEGRGPLAPLAGYAEASFEEFRP